MVQWRAMARVAWRALQGPSRGGGRPGVAGRGSLAVDQPFQNRVR